MPVKRYNGSNWEVISGVGLQGPAGTNGTNGTNGIDASPYAAGKNAIINGNFAVNQRNFSSSTTADYMFDRFFQSFSGGSVTSTSQTFTAGTAPVAGYEGKNYLQTVISGQSAVSDFSAIAQKIESVRTLANQTVTVSFWALAASGTPKISVELAQNFGTGGSPSSAVNTYVGQSTISTSWTRYSFSVALPSIAGKTLGTANDDHLRLNVYYSAGTNFNSRTNSMGTQNNTFSIWGIQVEAGSTATAFQTATGTIQGELAACQRYYYRLTSGAAYSTLIPVGITTSTTVCGALIQHPVPMRAVTSFEFSTIYIAQRVTTSADAVVTSATLGENNTNITEVALTVASGLTVRNFATVKSNNSAAAYIAVNGEL